MQTRSMFVVTILGGWLVCAPAWATEIATNPDGAATLPRTFSAKGVIQELPPDHLTVVIKHAAISNYMAAMTMPFKIKDVRLLEGLRAGDEIQFRLSVTADESWVDRFHKTGTAPVDLKQTVASTPAVLSPPGSFMDYALTNELGERVALRNFHGQALAITFFYTRCPLPDFCPRLSKNFQAATEKLRDAPGGPTNWHFLSISFDTEFDTPAMLKSYGDTYNYHANEWSFLTSSPEVVRELARISGVNYTASSRGFQHNFRTLIVDANGHLQMVFPTGGDLSADIVTQIIKAANATNQPTLSVRAH